MDMSKVKFVWSSDEINSHSNEYWLRVMDIARRFNLSRIKRCSQIMGREASDDLHASQIFYPCMQCADIFHLKVCEHFDINVLILVGRYLSTWIGSTQS